MKLHYLSLLLLLTSSVHAATASSPAAASSHTFLVTKDSLPPLPPPPSKPFANPAVMGLPDAPASDFRTFGSGLPISEFLRQTLGDIAKKPYVLTPAATALNSLISADFTRYKKKDIVPIVKTVLASSGLVLREQDGVYIVDKSDTKLDASSEYLVYRPHFRAVGSLSSYFSMFPDLSFAYSAGISVRTPSASAGAVGGQADSPMSTGSVAYSQLDKDPSFLVVRGSAGQLKSFKSFLSQIDIPVPEVMLRAYVFEVRDATNKDSAFSLVVNVLDSKLGLNAGLSVGSSATTGDSLKLTLPNVQLAVSALAGDSRVRLMSSPVLRAVDGSTASSTVGTDTPTLGAVVNTAGGGSQQSISYQSSGVVLSVSPRIFEDSIRLNIEQEVSSFVQTDTGITGTPTKLKRSFKSDVVAKSGEALLLGGLSESSVSDAAGSGFLFSSKSSSKSTSQIVVLLQVDKL